MREKVKERSTEDEEISINTASTSSPTPASTTTPDIAMFGAWLELAVASGRVVLPTNVTLEAVLWCLRQRRTSLPSLFSTWDGGAFGWQLKVSQLALQVPQCFLIFLAVKCIKEVYKKTAKL